MARTATRQPKSRPLRTRATLSSSPEAPSVSGHSFSGSYPFSISSLSLPPPNPPINPPRLTQRTLNPGGYPHQYNNYEGFSFPTAAPWYEFPILASHAVYAGASPGADRVIFDSKGALDKLITHTGASGNAFVACVKG